MPRVMVMLMAIKLPFLMEKERRERRLKIAATFHSAASAMAWSSSQRV